jgi:hypothetical protein
MRSGLLDAIGPAQPRLSFGDTMHVFLLIGLAVLVSGAVVGWTLEDRICAELRACHAVVWEAIGSPDRVFDDFGSARYFALRYLYRHPELLAKCNVSLLRRIRLRRMLGRLYPACAGVALAIGLAQYFGVI